MGTSGLVTAFDPMANGERMLVGGLMREIVAAMHKRGFLGPHVTEDFYQKRFHCWTPFQPEGYKLVLDELATAAGVEVRFFTRVVEADVDSGKHAVNGVVLHNIEGLRYVRAKTFVDATGDAVLTDLCGAPCREAGRDTEHIMPPTLCSQLAGIDWARAARSPGDTGPANQQALIEKAVREGHFTFGTNTPPGFLVHATNDGIKGGAHRVAAPDQARPGDTRRSRPHARVRRRRTRNQKQEHTKTEAVGNMNRTKPNDLPLRISVRSRPHATYT